MVKVIMGVKGTGKTKQMIEMINAAVTTENGNVVAIERGPKLTYDLNHQIRLIDTTDYDLTTFERMKGFIYGLYASNFDITHVFIDSLGKIVPNASVHDMEAFLDLVLYLLFNCYNKVIFHFFLGGEDVGLSLFRHFAQEEDQELLKVGFDELLAADVGVFLDQRVK